MQDLFRLSLTFLNPGWLTDWLTDWLTAKLLLVLASTVIFGSESHETRDHILLSDGSGSLHFLSHRKHTVSPLQRPTGWQSNLLKRNNDLQKQDTGVLRLGTLRDCGFILPCVNYISSWRSEEGKNRYRNILIKCATSPRPCSWYGTRPALSHRVLWIPSQGVGTNHLYVSYNIPDLNHLKLYQWFLYMIYLTIVTNSDDVGWWVVRDVVGSGRGTVGDTLPAFAWRDGRKHE
jgi:hypothetical protein